MDELTLLKALVSDEPPHDAEARTDVWQGLGAGYRRGRWIRPRRLALLGGVATTVTLTAVALILRTSGIGVEGAEAAACRRPGAPTAECVRALAAVVAPSSMGTVTATRRRIAFSKFVPGGADIYTMNTDGTGVRRLTTGDARTAFPAWSPDGQRIAFNRTGAFSRPNGIYVMNADGSGQKLLARGPWAVPAWSPDGTKIAFWKQEGIYVVDSNGRGGRLVRPKAFTPSWSPDGTKIAFSSGVSTYVMNADGTGERLLARGTAPAWSLDGRKIAYVGAGEWRNHTQPIWTMNADGSGKRRLRARSWIDCYLAWLPDGTRIAFSNPTGLFVKRRDGRNVVKLGSGDICGVAWQPLVRP